MEYIGIKKATKESPGFNLGLIFVKKENGMYSPINSPGIGPTVTEDQIKHDLELGYLKEYDR